MKIAISKLKIKVLNSESSIWKKERKTQKMKP